MWVEGYLVALSEELPALTVQILLLMNIKHQQI